MLQLSELHTYYGPSHILQGVSLSVGEREVVALHSYETPEIVAFPLTAGSRPYLDWLSASVAE